MNLADFHSLVSEEAKRGNSLDAVIPRRVQMAARWIERNYSFQYMEKLATIVLDPDNDDPRVVQVPLNIKTVRWLRIPNSEGEYSWMSKIDPLDEVRQETGFPAGYWLMGANYIIFNSVVEESYYGEALMKAYTPWPEADLDASPWLIDNATDALLFKTMEYIAVHNRDQQGVLLYKQEFAESLKTMMLEDEEKRYDGTSIQLGYAPNYPTSN